MAESSELLLPRVPAVDTMNWCIVSRDTRLPCRCLRDCGR